MADTLDAAGARHGILLISDGIESLVTRDDILDAIVALKRRIRADYEQLQQTQGKGASFNPRIVFYFMGHALGNETDRNLYLLPGNIVFDSFATQSRTGRLIDRTLWAWDIASALVNFRLHDSMSHFDDFFPSQLMPDVSRPESVFEVLQRQTELERIDQQRRRQNAYLPGGNPPVPFIMLLDNCFGDVTPDMTAVLRGTGIDSLFTGLIDTTVGALLNEAVAAYAARPGEDAYPVSLPGTENDRMGPVALHFVDMIEQADAAGRPLTLADIKSRFFPATAPTFTSPVHADDEPQTGNSSWRPYNPGELVEVRQDTMDAQMIPFTPNVAVRDEPRATGTEQNAVLCCRR